MTTVLTISRQETYEFQALSEREFRTVVMWHRDDEQGRILLDFENTNGCDLSHPIKPKSVLASQKTVWIFEPLPSIGDIPQTKVTLTSRIDLKSVFTSQSMNNLAPRFWSIVSDLRKRLDRSIGIDAFKRSQTIERIRSLEVESVLDVTGGFEAEPGMQRVGGRLGQTLVKSKGIGNVRGLTVATVRCDLEEAAAFFWDLGSRSNAAVGHHVVREIEEKTGDWEMIVKCKENIESEVRQNKEPQRGKLRL